jgi:hypothetical protein
VIHPRDEPASALVFHMHRRSQLPVPHTSSKLAIKRTAHLMTSAMHAPSHFPQRALVAKPIASHLSTTCRSRRSASPMPPRFPPQPLPVGGMGPSGRFYSSSGSGTSTPYACNHQSSKSEPGSPVRVPPPRKCPQRQLPGQLRRAQDPAQQHQRLLVWMPVRLRPLPRGSRRRVRHCPVLESRMDHTSAWQLQCCLASW